MVSIGARKLAHLKKPVVLEFDLTPAGRKVSPPRLRLFKLAEIVPDTTNEVQALTFFHLPLYYDSLLVFAAYKRGVLLINSDPHS